MALVPLPPEQEAAWAAAMQALADLIAAARGEDGLIMPAAGEVKETGTAPAAGVTTGAGR